MKKICIILLAISALPLVFSSSAEAKPYHRTTVAWVVENRNNLDVDDSYVTLVGHVTRRMGDEEYWFTDGTGSVRLDSENFDLPIGTRILVGGRIDQAYLGFGHLEVDVRRWHYAPLAKRIVAMRPPVIRATPPPTPPPAPASVAPANTAPASTAPSTLAPPSESPATPAATTTTTTTTTAPTSTTPSSADASGTNATTSPGK